MDTETANLLFQLLYVLRQDHVVAAKIHGCTLRTCVGVLVVATGVAMREPGRLTKVSGKGVSEVC